MYNFLSHFIVDHRRLVLACIGAFFIACLIIAPRVEFNFTPQQIFESTTGADEYREVFAERFGREDNLITILVSGEDILQPDALGPIRDLTYELRFADSILDAQSVATMAIPRPDSLNADPHLGDLIREAGNEGIARPVRGPPVDQAAAESLAEYAMSEPMIVDRLVSQDRQTALIVAWIESDIQEISHLKEVTEQIAAAAALYDFPDDITVEVRGIPPLRVDIVDSLRGEQIFFIPLTALIFLLILIFLFRRPSGVILPLGTVLIALIATMALLVVTGSNINIINNVLPTLIFVIGISDSIHMITRHSEEVAIGKSHNEAVRAMIRHTGAACLLTTGTTAIGFLSLLAAETSILQAFGWQAAAGVMFAYVATLFFLSAGLTYMRPAARGRSSSNKDNPALLERSLMVIGTKILSRPWTVVTVGMLLVAAIGFQGTRVVVDTTVLEIFGDEHPTAIATRTIEQKLGGILPMEVSLESETLDRFKDPKVYTAVAELQHYADEQKQVLSSESYVDYLQAARVAITGDLDQRISMPENLNQIEQLLLIISDAPDSDSGMANFVTGDFRNARVLLRVEDSGANASLALADDLKSKIEELFDEFEDIDYHITGDAYVASLALNSFIRDLLMSLLLAIVIIFFLMTIVFRSLKVGLISLIPNTMPLLITYGYMGMAGITLNTTTTIIFAISLGIAVDDAIHFFARFIEERGRQPDLKQAILQTYFGAGRAILLTSILLVLGLSILMFSQFIPTQQFGLLTAITIGSAVVADLVILPALLYLVYSRFPGKIGDPPLQAGPVDGEQ